MYCQNCGAKLPENDPSQPNPASALRRYNAATIIFASLAVLSVLVSVVKGVVPLYLLYAAMWAVIAWHWHSKRPANSTALVLYLAVGMAGVAGYFTPHPTKIQSNRIDAKVNTGSLSTVTATTQNASDSNPESAIRRSLEPEHLMFLCGKPQSDDVTKASTGANRWIVYRGSSGSTIGFMYLRAGNHDWVPLWNSATGPAASVLLSELPCLEGLPSPTKEITRENHDAARNRELLKGLTGEGLVARCGQPLEDTSQSSYYPGIETIKRRLSYRSASGSTVTFEFIKPITVKRPNAPWWFMDMEDAGLQYDNENGGQHIVEALPCIDPHRQGS